MTAKDFLNYKKPHFWVASAIVVVLALAGVVSVFNKEKTSAEPEETVEKVQVEIKEEPEEPEQPPKTDREIILERFQAMDWEEVKKNAKAFGEEGWEEGIVLLAELPQEQIRLYGYNDADYKYQGVAVEHNGNVNYFDWKYISSQHIQPEMYWNAARKHLQITLNLFEGSGVNAEELHVLVELETGTMEDFVYRSADYLNEIEERMNGTGVTVGSYVDIRLGDTMMLQFEPVKTVDGEETVLKLHQAVIYLNPSKDGFEFELGDIGVEPEKRAATITLEGSKESFTEVEYISNAGFTIWYPEYILEPYKLNGYDGFVVPGQGTDSMVKVTLVPSEDVDIDQSFLKEAAANFKSSKEYKKVTTSKIQKVKAADKNVSIRTIEVVHDDTADRFYLVKGKNHVLLVTVSLPKEALEGMGARINQMLGTISFVENTKEVDE